jgi:hypothetical protein
LTPTDRRALGVAVADLPAWRSVLHIVKPETVVGCHRRGFRLFWTWKSQRAPDGWASRPT